MKQASQTTNATAAALGRRVSFDCGALERAAWEELGCELARGLGCHVLRVERTGEEIARGPLAELRALVERHGLTV